MAYFNGVWYLEHDEPRPENPLPGACIIEIDTSKVYFYSSRKNTWYEWGAESNAASTLSITRPSLTLGNTFSPSVIDPEEEQEVDEEEQEVDEEEQEAVEEEMPEEAVPDMADTTEDGEGE